MNKLVLSVLFIALAAGAEARTAIWTLTCAAAKGLVLKQGAVLFDTGPNTFDRFVSDASFCPYDQRLQPAWAPTRDQPQCMIGYICGPRIPSTPSVN